MKKPILSTKASLAAALEVSRSTLDRYLKMDGAPMKADGAWDLARVLEFVQSRALKESTAQKFCPDIAALKSREISLRCERMRFHLDVHRGKFLDKAKVISTLNEILHEQQHVLRQALETDFPLVMEGLDIVSARIKGKKLNDGICDKMRLLIDKAADW